MSTHETYTRADDAPPPSERSFGWVMTGAFALVALAPLLHGRAPRLWALAIAAAVLIATLTAPRVLAPANHAWMALGHVLNRIVSPIVMGLLFLLVVAPTGLALRLMGKDPLRLKFDPRAASYWQPRVPPGPAPGSLKQQF